MTRRSTAMIAAIGLAAGLIGDGTVTAKPPTLAFDIAGTYDSDDEPTVQVARRNDKVRVRTSGFAGTGTVTCTSQACHDRGLDGTDVDVVRDLEIVLDFKGSDEELQAVHGRSRGNSIFTDGFESGDLSAVRGTGSCVATATGDRVCSVELRLRGRLRGPALSGRIALTMVGELTLSGATGSWGVVDWVGRVEART